MSFLPRLSRPVSAWLALALGTATAPAAPSATLVAHVETGKQPTTVTLLDDGTRIAVGNRGDESVWIYDAETLEVLAKHSLIGKHGVWGVAQIGDGRLLVSNWKGETLTVIDGLSGEAVGRIPVGIKPSYLAVSPDGAKAYAAGQLSGDVSIVDIAKLEPDRILEVGSKPMGVAASADGRWLYAAAGSSRKISRIDLKYEVVLSTFGAPLATTTNLALTPDGRILLAAGENNRLLVMDAETGRTDKIKVGADPAAVAIDPSGRHAYVACYKGASIAIVDLANRQVVQELPVGPGCIDVATDGRRVYSVSDQAAALSVFELGLVAPADIPMPATSPAVGDSPEPVVSPLVEEDGSEG
jgi:DNA-binding beta-propeller fold protein YncE